MLARSQECRLVTSTVSSMKDLQITRLKNDIMWVLEEAGEETVGTIFNTLRKDNERSPREAFESEIDQAISGLVRDGLVEFAAINRTNRRSRVGIGEILEDFDGKASSLIDYDIAEIWITIEFSQAFEPACLGLTDKGMKYFQQLEPLTQANEPDGINYAVLR